jgi:hypothetical protein
LYVAVIFKMQFLTIWDLVLTPIYLGLLIFIAKRYRDKHYHADDPLRKYYLPGLYVKLFGAIFIALIYQYYYGGGDTSNYFRDGNIINSSLQDSFSIWMKLILGVSPDSDPRLYTYTSQMSFYNDTPSRVVDNVSAVLGLVSFNTYIPTALLFAFLCYTGVWVLFKTFAKVYAGLTTPLAIAFLFIPSSFIWGSAIFKDTICVFGLGWMVYTSFRIFVNRDLSIKNLSFLVLSFYLLVLVKIYILLAFLPAVSLWILLNYSHKITSVALKLLTWFFFIGIVAGGSVLMAQKFSSELNRYSLDRIAQTATSTAGYIFSASNEDASTYSLGEPDPTIQGMLRKFPAGVVVTLFRPFPWEAKKVIVFLSALESLLFLFGTALVIYRNGFFGFWRRIFKDPNLTFFLTFSIIFAFAVGVSSYNFGALSRYKIPCLPFYAALLIILYYLPSSKTKTNTFKKSLLRKPVQYS